MLLNNTPVRTCRKFNINNIEFKGKIPSGIQKFENTKIFKETEKDEIVTDFPFEDFNIKYGTGLVDQIKEQANQKIRINVNSRTDKEIRIEYGFDESNLKLVDYIEINGEENTTSNIYIVYRNRLCKDNCDDISKRCSGVNCAPYKAFHNGLIKINTKPNSKMIVNIINLMSKESTNILSIDNRIEESSKSKK